MILRATTKYPDKDGKPTKFYGCTRWPACKGTHGAHPDGRPLGMPATQETKRARIRAHEAFGAWLRRHSYTKRYGYKELARMLDVPKAGAHMGMMNTETCEAVVRLCSEEREQHD